MYITLSTLSLCSSNNVKDQVSHPHKSIQHYRSAFYIQGFLSCGPSSSSSNSMCNWIGQCLYKRWNFATLSKTDRLYVRCGSPSIMLTRHQVLTVCSQVSTAPASSSRTFERF